MKICLTMSTSPRVPSLVDAKIVCFCQCSLYRFKKKSKRILYCARNMISSESLVADSNPNSTHQDVINEETQDNGIIPSSQIENALINLEKCKDAMYQICALEEKLSTTYFMNATSNPLINLEDILLSLSMCPLIDGIYYIVVFKPSENIVSARYFEFGSYQNFFHDICFDELKNKYDSFVHQRIYNEKDVAKAHKRHSNLYNTKRNNQARDVATKNYQTFIRNVYDNKYNVNDSIRDFLNETKEKGIECCSLICCIMTKKQSWEDSKDKLGRSKQRYFFSSSDAERWDQDLAVYRANPENKNNILSIFEQRSGEIPIHEQHFLINQLPNLHKWPWDDLNKVNIFFEQRFAISCRRYPGSPRNRIIQAVCFRDDKEEIISACLLNAFGERCFKVPYPEKKSVAGYKRKKKPTNQTCEGNNSSNVVISDSVIANTHTLEVAADGDSEMEGSSDCPATDRKSLFDYYCSELFSNGMLAWRIRSTALHVVLMNGYHAQTGNFLVNDFVHVRGTVANGNIILHCSCSIFTVALTDSQPLCCHTRLLNLILSNNSSSGSKFINKVKVEEAMLISETDVLKLPSKEVVDKFSVKAEDDVEFVTLYNVTKSKRNIVKCHSSRCRMSEGSCRNIRTISTNDYLCPHLSVFRSFYVNIILARNLNLPVEIVEDVTEHVGFQFEEFDNDTPLVLPDEKWQDVFDPSTGMWKFHEKSPSQQKVDSDSLSDQLKSNIRRRINGKRMFSPDIPQGQCLCEGHWVEADSDSVLIENLVFDRKINLYTDRGVESWEIYVRKCMSNNCVLKWDGAEDSVFCLSNDTCAGYEIGWSFVDSVLSSKQTFSGFVSVKNKEYQRFGSDPFMSSQTFIRWFFAWASCMKIDFRESCYGCKGNLSVLACDGTKIGISFKESFITPIEHPVKNAPPHQQTRRLNRCFIKTNSDSAKQYSSARAFLRNLTDAILHENSLPEIHDIQNFKRFLPQGCLPSFEIMMTSEKETKRMYAAVFKLLSYDSSVDAIVPFKALPIIESFLFSISADVGEFCSKMRSYCPEISTLIYHTCHDSRPEDIIYLLKEITDTVKSIHSNDLPPDVCSVIEGSYNPPKFGRAYYFTNHGCQVREIRKFPIDTERKSNFDDLPDVVCEKSFPSVSKKGSSYLFLWFCPLHGHCLGFHIIPGAEGRKDPAASLYSYMEVPPDVVLYDFACSLSEYVHNRESGYFSNTRFYHDIFHGYSHKCSPAFRCDRIPEYSTINTQVCEQFNSFLQNIKASGRLMSQTHFTFYCQFMIHHWNKMKRSAHEKLEKIAELSKQ